MSRQSNVVLRRRFALMGLLLLLLLSPMRLSAYEFEYTYERQTLKYTVIDEDARTARVYGTSNSGDMIIPETAYDGRIPFSVTEIGDEAFYECSGMTSVTIPNSVTYIGYRAFGKCSGLTSVTIPKSVTSIDIGAFAVCSGLTSLTIGNSVTSIGNNAFSGCTGLTSLTIGNSVTSIGEFAFYQCSGLTSLIIPDSVISIGGNAFCGCSGLTALTIGNSVTSIGICAFFGCTGLTSLTIPNSVTSIDIRAFGKCSGLTSVTIGNSVSSIAYEAFESCSRLKDVIIGKSTNQIANDVFEKCELKRIAIPDVPNFDFNGAEKIIKYPKDAIIEDGCIWTNDKFYFMLNDFKGEYVIPESVTEIGEDACLNCTGLTSIGIGPNMRTIGTAAFNGCANLTEVVYNAANCNSYQFPTTITNVKFGGSVETIPESAFSGCKLQDVVIPPTVTKIGASAFKDNGIRSIAMGYSVKEIGDGAFAGNEDIAALYSTAINPPAARSDVFSNYKAQLWLASDEAIKNYQDALRTWYLFEDMHRMIPVTKMSAEKMSVSGAPGETIKLGVKIEPEDATLRQIFWKSTRPDLVSVDHNGNATILDGAAEGEECKVIAMSMFEGVVTELTVTVGSSGIEDVIADEAIAEPKRPNDIYTLQGVCLKRGATKADIDALAPGLYIVGGKKIIIR